MNTSSSRSNCARHGGYTLLELMMVLFIISILTMIAIPAYQDYKTRVKVSEGINMAGAVATSVAEYYLSQDHYPDDNTQAGLASPSSYQTAWVSEIRIVNVPTSGSIAVTFNSATIPALGANNTIIFVPDYNGGRVAWDCSYGSLENRFRPKDCRK